MSARGRQQRTPGFKFAQAHGPGDGKMEREGLPALLHLGCAQVHDRKAEEGERQRLVAERKLNWNER